MIILITNYMKRNLIILLLSTLIFMFTACESKSKRYVEWEHNQITVGMHKIDSNDLRPEIIINNTFKFKGQTYHDVTYRGCEYIVNDHNGIFVHKGNCNNIIHINIK